MQDFVDYYAVLGVEADASASTIKAAFKKLALKYHPDVYKGEDAQDRMRILLLAYQTLSNPQTRKAHDSRRSEHLLDVSSPSHHFSPSFSTAKAYAGGKQEVSPTARRDRQRHYDFPSLAVLDHSSLTEVRLGEMVYQLSAAEAATLKQQGILRGVLQVMRRGMYTCHRCHHCWTRKAVGGRSFVEERVCPACKARDWPEYLLLRCVHCQAVFESEQIRYEVGSYQYGDAALCPPYELFPLCPYCGAASWCPAEEARLNALRIQTAHRIAMQRLILISVAVVAVLVFALVISGVLR
jgi:DnaJ-class molecular chaperone